MKLYDAQTAPDPTQWLQLDEQKRIALVEDFHRRKSEKADGNRLHVLIHVTVETQIAMNEPLAAREAVERLMAEGVDRHEAVHALGLVLVDHLGKALDPSNADGFATGAYAEDLDRLTAGTWRAQSSPTPNEA